MDTFSIPANEDFEGEAIDSFLASPEVREKTTAHLSRVEAMTSWSPRACVAFSALSLLLRLREMLSRIALWMRDITRVQKRDANRSSRRTP
jgi:hypothetical protein